MMTGSRDRELCCGVDSGESGGFASSSCTGEGRRAGACERAEVGERQRHIRQHIARPAIIMPAFPRASKEVGMRELSDMASILVDAEAGCQVPRTKFGKKGRQETVP